MGMDLAYFRAADDLEAAVAQARPGGPLGWLHVTGRRKVGLFRTEPVTARLRPAWPGFVARGYDPMVTLGTLEELLTGRRYHQIAEDPRWGAALSPEPAGGGRGVVCVTDTLRNALAAASDEFLVEVAGPWSHTEELRQPGWEQVTVEEHLALLHQLRDLAAAAVREAGRLYCYYEA